MPTTVSASYPSSPTTHRATANTEQTGETTEWPWLDGYIKNETGPETGFFEESDQAVNQGERGPTTTSPDTTAYLIVNDWDTDSQEVASQDGSSEKILVSTFAGSVLREEVTTSGTNDENPVTSDEGVDNDKKPTTEQMDNEDVDWTVKTGESTDVVKEEPVQLEPIGNFLQ